MAGERVGTAGPIQAWLYDHAPKPVREWLDNRELRRQAEEHYAKEATAPPTKTDYAHTNAGKSHASYLTEPREVEDMGFVGPRTDRGWVAHSLNLAGEERRAGNLASARNYVETARQDRVAYRSPQRLPDGRPGSPYTDRSWVAYYLNQAAAARKSGDLGIAKSYVESARQGRVPYQQQVGLSR